MYISYCTFKNLVSTSYGGGLYFNGAKSLSSSDTLTLKIIYSTFTSNTAVNGGAIAVILNDIQKFNGLIENSTLNKNSAV